MFLSPSVNQCTQRVAFHDWNKVEMVHHLYLAVSVGSGVYLLHRWLLPVLASATS